MVGDEAAPRRTTWGLRSMPRTEPVGPTRSASRFKTPRGRSRGRRHVRRLDPNLLELSVGIRGEIGALALEPFLLGLAVTEQIVVRLHHGTLFISGQGNEVPGGYNRRIRRHLQSQPTSVKNFRTIAQMSYQRQVRTWRDTMRSTFPMGIPDQFGTRPNAKNPKAGVWCARSSSYTCN